jgi:TatD family-associated radical SAM protein
MGQIIYFVGSRKNNAYLNITPKYACTNDCVFCDKEVVQGSTGNDLYLEKEPTLEEVIAEMKNKVRKGEVKEFVFCGVGEPLLYLDKVIDITRHIKKEYSAKVRINTNGQAYLLYPKRDVIGQLERAGVDYLSISLNVTNETDYNRLHRPRRKGAFDALLKFIKDASASKIDTTVSFIEFPELDKDDVFRFTRKLGLKNEQVRFRPYLQ